MQLMAAPSTHSMSGALTAAEGAPHVPAVRADLTGRVLLPASGQLFLVAIRREARAWGREFREAGRFAAHLARRLGPAILHDVSALAAAALIAPGLAMGMTALFAMVSP